MGSLAMLKKKVANQKVLGKETVVNSSPKKETVVNTMSKAIVGARKKTPVALKSNADINTLAKAENLTRDVLRSNKTIVLPSRGYHAVGKNDMDKLEAIKQDIIAAGICAFDYETNGDPDDNTQDPQDHELVMVSVACNIGQAFCFPLGMSTYGANWDINWFIENFLKPILEHPDVLLIIHNVKAEHGWSLLYGVDMFPKACAGKVIDTMLMVKALALDENTVPMGDGYEVQVGLKPATKALLADDNGMVHGLMHVDDIKSFAETVGKAEWEEPTGEFYKSGAKKGLPKTKKCSRSRTFNELPVDQKVIDYSCSDSDWALGLYYRLMPLCESEGIIDVIKELDVPRMMVLAEYELAGWQINPKRLEAMGKVADDALAVLEPKLYEGLLEVTEKYADTDDEGNIIVPAGIYGMGDYRGEPISLEIKSSKPFSWGSIQHLQWLFFHVIKVSTNGLTRSKKSGLPGTGKENIDIIIERASTNCGNKFIDVLKEKRKYDKIKSTYVGELNEDGKYVGGMLQYCRPDTQKLHTNLNLVSTWRLSSKKPNLQNIPRADNDPMGIREVFEAPTYDLKQDYSGLRSQLTRPTIYININKLSGVTVWVGADYSQIELKVLAWYAGEKSMIDTLAHGGDLHAKAAHDVFKLPCTIDEVKKLYKPYRYRAKKVNFGLVYGMTEYGLSADPQMGMTVDEAKAFIEQYMRTYPGVRGYQHDLIAFARTHGYVETMFGHRRPIPEINHPNKWIRQKGENKAMNSPIQGSAADIIALAMVNVRKEAPSWLKPVIQIHDELQCECPIEYAAAGARILKEIMEKPIEGFSDVMPIIAEPSVGKIWRHALDVSWDDHGTPYVKPKHERKEATDVTYEDIGYMMDLYKLAGIEVR
jgi:DNA polymerase I-like protein with 3'-5' exonuclease and polymerase domains